ncbi:hypothetical protein M1843_08985 [Isoptericola sp. 4D.3]|jgi:hypothetical protein|uniref:Transporter n=1 Tax=Isoptericola peretonis TaxID=2918523 RepID=A0ABT0J325_9MICO|nr:hypothetical protein [Isoptericola sp. 4D.3]
MTSTPDSPGDDVAGLPAADSLRLIREQQDRARSALEPDARALYGAWGVAWLVGYLVLWTSGRGQEQPEAWAYWVFGGALAAAVVFTMVHTMRRTAGTRGVSARTGAMYGWAWMLGFLTLGVLLGGLARAGAGTEVMGLASNGGACLVVGLLYLAGAAAFGDRNLFVLGAWILLVAGAATLVGLPGTYLVMALAGGGGFLVMAGVEQLRVVRGRRHPEEGAGRA